MLVDVSESEIGVREGALRGGRNLPHGSARHRGHRKLLDENVFDVRLVVEGRVDEWDPGPVVAGDFLLGGAEVVEGGQAEMLVGQSVLAEIEIWSDDGAIQIQGWFVKELEVGRGQEVGDDFLRLASDSEAGMRHVATAGLPVEVDALLRGPESADAFKLPPARQEDARFAIHDAFPTKLPHEFVQGKAGGLRCGEVNSALAGIVSSTRFPSMRRRQTITHAGFEEPGVLKPFGSASWRQRASQASGRRASAYFFWRESLVKQERSEVLVSCAWLLFSHYAGGAAQ